MPRCHFLLRVIVTAMLIDKHCVKSIRIRIYSRPNAGKCGPEKLRQNERAFFRSKSFLKIQK